MGVPSAGLTVTSGIGVGVAFGIGVAVTSGIMGVPSAGFTPGDCPTAVGPPALPATVGEFSAAVEVIVTNWVFTILDREVEVEDARSVGSKLGVGGIDDNVVLGVPSVASKGAELMLPDICRPLLFDELMLLEPSTPPSTAARIMILLNKIRRRIPFFVRQNADFDFL